MKKKQDMMVVTLKWLRSVLTIVASYMSKNYFFKKLLKMSVGNMYCEIFFSQVVRTVTCRRESVENW